MNTKNKLLPNIFSFLVVFVLLAGLTGPAVASPLDEVYIVMGEESLAVQRAVISVGGLVLDKYDSIQGVSARLSDLEAQNLEDEPGINLVSKDAEVTLQGEEIWDEEGGEEKTSPSTDYPDVSGADLVWAEGYNGEGVTVAVLDTGISRHRGLVRDTNGKQGRIVGWLDLVNKKKLPFDSNGHGTHVAGIIANSQLGEDKEWNGMAPGVNLVGVRVLDKEGKGTYKNVIKGIDWVIKNKDKYGISLINLSLVSTVKSPYWSDPLNVAIMRAWQEGITVVVAAGNTGSDPVTVGVPGNNPYVITVGAFTDNYTPNDWNDDYIAPFSAAGPTLDGFVKPDIVAPGAHIVSTMLPKSVIAKNHQANRVANQYFSMAGTSQASAVTTGAAALILSKNPGLSPNEVKYRLMYTAFPWTNPDSGDAVYSVWQQGAGRINARDAALEDISGSANEGMDIAADISGDQHYEGFTYYDEASESFMLHGDDGQSGSFGLWSGSFGLWSGSFGLWSGSFGLWSGSFGLWSGSFGLWSGSFGLWSGSFGLWSGGYTNWATADGNTPWTGTPFSNTAFVEKYRDGTTSASETSTTSITKWVKEP